jgi:hypothetical protein
MGCPICDNKPANCDCTATEREQFDEIESLQSEIDRLREERRWVESQVVISRETFDKVVAALSHYTIVANEDGEEFSDEEVIDARDSILRDAEQPLPPGPEGDG